MSATRDKSQKTTFVYSNLYNIYKKGKGTATQRVLKAENLNDLSLSSVRVRSHSVVELLGKRLPKAAPLSSQPVVANANPAIESLKENLKQLNDLHVKLRFMLKELEELVKN